MSCSVVTWRFFSTCCLCSINILGIREPHGINEYFQFICICVIIYHPAWHTKWRRTTRAYDKSHILPMHRIWSYISVIINKYWSDVYYVPMWSVRSSSSSYLWILCVQSQKSSVNFKSHGAFHRHNIYSMQLRVSARSIPVSSSNMKIVGNYDQVYLCGTNKFGSSALVDVSQEIVRQIKFLVPRPGLVFREDSSRWTGPGEYRGRYHSEWRQGSPWHDLFNRNEVYTQNQSLILL